jgi:hypothetical protein
MTTYQLAFSNISIAHLEHIQKFLQSVYDSQVDCITNKQKVRAIEKLAYINEVLKQRKLLEAIS